MAFAPGSHLSCCSACQKKDRNNERKEQKYFDFYLFHNVYEGNIDAYLDPKYGILEYLLKQKENGRIRHLGFLAHGSAEIIRRFLDVCGQYMEFCQLQINYMDWHFQNAQEKVAVLQKAGILVWVMEPLKANIATYETDESLREEEFDTLVRCADEETKKGGLPCTACHYCTSHCPKKLPIPELIALYNEHKITGGGFIAPMAVGSMPEEKRPANCVGCRGCEQVCPQQIRISEMMKDFTSMIGM